MGIFLSQSAISYSQDTEIDDRVWEIKIEGNKTFQGPVIKNVIANESPSLLKKIVSFRKVGMRVSETEFRRDVIRIERFYQRQGFINVEVYYEIRELKNKSWKKTLVFVVVENKPVIVQSNQVSFTNNQDIESLSDGEYKDFESLLNRLPFKKGQRYEPINKTYVEGEIESELKNLGFVYVKANVEAEVDSTNLTADVRINIDAGQKNYFQNVIIEGNESVDDQYVVRESGIKRGEVFSEEKMREAQREVFSNHLFRFALLSIPDQEPDSTLDVLIRIRELPLRSVQIKFGVGNFDRLEEQLRVGNSYKVIRGQLSWTHRNVAGRGERFSTSISASAFDQQIRADYLFPYVFNTKSSFISSPFIRHKIEPSYEIVSGGITNNFVYNYSQELTSSLGYEFTNNNEITRKSQEILPDTVLNYNVSSFRLNAYYSSSVRQQTNGWLVQPSLEFSGLFNEATFSFQKASIDIRKYTEISRTTVLATRFDTGIIYYSRQDSLPQDILYYSGGTSSVRGWNLQQLGPKRAVLSDDGSFERYVPRGGKAVLSFNVEIRQKLNSFIKGFGTAVFLDAGQVYPAVNEINAQDLQFGIGGGFRYQSPIGPIRIDVGYKLNPTDEDLNIYQGQNFGSAWNRWGLHLSIGQAF